MQNVARQVLAPRGNAHHAPQGQALKELRSESTFTIFGYETGGFAIISNDDLLPEVLGYSSSRYDSSARRNTNFEWWLDAVADVAGNVVKSGVQLQSVRPEDENYEPFVDAMVTTQWGQETPYNNLCPYGTNSGQNDWQNYAGGEGRCVTGCVATAMAQVLNYHQFPEIGTNTTHSVMVNGVKYTVEYGKENYDWEHMLDDYHCNYTDEEGRAVALLMLHCGVAANMEYATDGSGTQMSDALSGLHTNFGFDENVRLLSRYGATEKEWMNVIFTELSAGRPIIYAGTDFKIFAGHAFVFDGYEESGKVHVNWGWEGDCDGFYEVSLLNPDYLSFSSQQEMIIGIDGPKPEPLEKTIAVPQPGQLADLIDDSERLLISSLTLSGDLNGSDLAVICEMAGRTLNGKSVRGKLSVLNLADARFIKSSEPFLIDEDGKAYTITQDDMLPERAFMACRYLSDIVLPKGINCLGDAAFALCSRLVSLTLEKQETSNYVYDDGVFYTPDRKEIISVLPLRHTPLTIEPTVSRIRDYAFSGCGRIGVITVKSFNPIPADENAFMRFGGTRFVIPAGSKSLYTEATGWKNVITEEMEVGTYGTCFIVRNSARYYGSENPKLRYTKQGDNVEGEPALSCEATPESPVGQYPIHIEKGTLEGEDLFFIDGVMKVGRAILTVSVEDVSRPRYEENPELYISGITGFVLDEDENVIKEMPTVHTTATPDSPEGDYKFYIVGGEADNYIFEYDGKGVFTVTGPTSISELIAGQHAADIYTLDGVLVRRQATTTEGLSRGIYVIEGRKVIIK